MRVQEEEGQKKKWGRQKNRLACDLGEFAVRSILSCGSIKVQELKKRN